jgi:hypothetical protein
MLAAFWYGLPKTPMQLGLLRRGDWSGIALMAIGLAALQTVLDDGNLDDWFGSPCIVKLSLIAGTVLVAFVVIELFRPVSSVNPQLLSGNLQQYSLAHGVAGVTREWTQAVIAVGNAIRAQATVMGHADCFALLGAVLLTAILPIVLLRKGTGSGGAAH